ncbi:sensor histidine kinase [Amycolatopsis sp. CA-230715]|uniref:sensor histidine kinase n=1 Tax=Amycolatopsis sp. CA-230715 TaxID=2745196 RepID=UPI001C030DA5|nr:histidine kinase [Amycolatopsis sp. CA-230715]QWF84429.1 hypothetical protein HUW46_07879 [Amycolatopsis sp. CA-230715]
MALRRVLGPVVSRSTYRGWIYLVVGGAMLVPYLLLVAVVVPMVLPVVLEVPKAFVVSCVLALLVLAGTTLLSPVRVLEGTAVRELLGDPVPDAVFGPVHDWRQRWRSGAMVVVHVLVGGVLSTISLLVPIAVGLSIAGPFTGRLALGSDQSALEVPKGWAGIWVPLVALLGALVFLYVVAGSVRLLAMTATRLLDVSPSERIAQLERRTERLAERNRLARELHDSVGHALSVVTIQAGAARRTLRRDPDFTERALTAIEDSARAALDDLDHVLGLLREETSGKAPQASLGELPALLSATRLAGVEVESEVTGELAALPPVVSREAYRIVQECLTNVVRHAGKVPVTLRVAVGESRLDLLVRNPLGQQAPAERRGGGRGLRGMAERVDVLRGELHAGRAGEHWEVGVKLPWGAV